MNHREIEENKFLLISILIIGVIVAFLPFVSNFIPRGFMPDFAGFKDFRRFVYAISQPVSMLFFSIFVLVVSSYCNREIKRLLSLFSLPFIATSVFNIIWVFYYDPDLPTWAYYTIIAIASITITIAIWSFYNYKKSIESKFVKTINYILYNRVETVLPLVKEEDQAKRAEIALENEDKLKETLNEVF
ncbi:hypothetical protein UJ101_02555 [Flavobacteriaceae bacterium UJ101]|nr:hypothetical protein UJ101_02555 [Flavobacteriaceae bacterium UJ101]